MKVGICAIIKNQDPQILKDWLEWHSLIGVDYFFIYDNDSDKAIDLDCPNTFVKYFPGKVQQLNTYNNCLELQRNKKLPTCDWIAFIDDDEYIMIEDGDLKSFLKKQNANAIGLNWITFSTCGNFKTKKKQLQSYTKHLPVNDQMNCHIKTICRPEQTKDFPNPHFVNLFNEGKTVGVFGNIIEGAFTERPTNEIAWINHYYTKSLEEFLEKIKKGRVDSRQPYDISMYYKINEKATEVDTKTPIIYAKIINHDSINNTNRGKIKTV